MIPFSHTWPYEQIRSDLYVQECPFCGAERVLLPLKPQDRELIHAGAKKLLVFPCCFGKATLVDFDSDYMLADKPLRDQQTKRRR
ncbi:hypothetical protein J31TS4_40760 [Paenibacillus sp. J31TS4]|uniref:hypothetical protein n=1 Tax=Paenibacillus sp. J31TS4 TaxID=2807195 RepID=UPI001B079C5C|nr:hypothetical protein [Paenibacillus sp. J31TS4]GIP40796.1 hypothetical protein J31TS4_40760 [Paenibacillus sp. J31TS4]